MPTATLLENLFSSDPVSGVYMAVQAGTIVTYEEGDGFVILEEFDSKKIYRVSLKSRKFQSNGKEYKDSNANIINSRFIGGKEEVALVTVEDVLRKHKMDSRFISFFNVVVDVINRTYKTKVIIDSSIMTLGIGEITNISLLDTVENFSNYVYGSREYQGLVADTAEYLHAYLQIIFKGDLKRKIKLSSSLLAMSDKTIMYPFISACIKLK